MSSISTLAPSQPTSTWRTMPNTFFAAPTSPVAPPDVPLEFASSAMNSTVIVAEPSIRPR